MKIFLPWMIAITILLSGCSGVPSEQTIQTAIAETQLAQITITPIYTATPVYTSTPDIPPTPTQDIRQITINEVIALLNNHTADSYQQAGEKLGEFGSVYGIYADDEEIQTLRAFWLPMYYLSTDLDNGLNYHEMFYSISPDYSGVYYQEIRNTVLHYMSTDEWRAGYLDWLPVQKTVIAQLKLPSPAIGMTKDQVRQSSWGEPDDINSTTTANSVTEQWVYGNGRYLYFEDGILTAIQE